MPWIIEKHEEVAVVTMNSSNVNKQNPDFFHDLHDALDRLEKTAPMAPLVLTGQGATFCAGLDLDYSFALFAREDIAEITAWWKSYREINLRLLKYPRPTIAAVNGHAFAGGLILALCCDYRIGVSGASRFALNEVPIGIPMPSIYTEIIRLRVDDKATGEAILFGDVYDVDKAREMGFLNQVVEADQLLATAIQRAKVVPKAALKAYECTKATFLHPFLLRMEAYADKRDYESIRVMASKDSQRAQSDALVRLRRR